MSFLSKLMFWKRAPKELSEAAKSIIKDIENSSIKDWEHTIYYWGDCFELPDSYYTIVETDKFVGHEDIRSLEAQYNDITAQPKFSQYEINCIEEAWYKMERK